jgi:hypothetical protein
MGQMPIINQLLELISSKTLKEILEQSLYQQQTDHDTKNTKSTTNDLLGFISTLDMKGATKMLI